MTLIYEISMQSLDKQEEDVWTAEVRRARWAGISDEEWAKVKRRLQIKLEQVLEAIGTLGDESSDEDEEEDDDEGEEEEEDDGCDNCWETLHGKVNIDQVVHYITHGCHQEGGGYVYFRKGWGHGMSPGVYRWTRQWQDRPTYKGVDENNKMLIYTCNCVGRQMFKLVPKGYKLQCNEIDFETFIEKMYDKN